MCLISAAWQAYALAVFVKVIFLFGLCRPCAALVKGAHGKHDMTMGVAAVGVVNGKINAHGKHDMTMGVAAIGVVNGKINAHSSGNKLRGTVFPDKPDLFLSG